VQEVKPGQVEVNVCLAQPDFAPYRHAWLEERGSGMSLTLVLGQKELPIEDVIAQSMDFSKLDTTPQTARADDESDRHYIERNVQLISGQREVASQILRIVANALIYIDQSGGQGRTRWPDDAPKGMLAKLEGAAKGSKQEKKLLSQLATATNEIVVVGMRQNPFPKKARKLLDAAGLPYKYLEYGSYLGEWRRRLALKMWTGWPTFPMVFVKGVLVGANQSRCSPRE